MQKLLKICIYIVSYYEKRGNEYTAQVWKGILFDMRRVEHNILNLATEMTDGEDESLKQDILAFIKEE